MSDALDALIEAVEAGNEDEVSSLCRSMNRDAHDAGTFWPAHDVSKAFRGSLDAALNLHEALLPGWAVDDMSQSGMRAGHPWGIRLGYWNASNPGLNRHSSAGWGRDAIPDGNPARAWMLAILRAYREVRK